MFFLQLSGVPGSGKSTLALEIAKRIDVVIVDHDVTKTALLEAGIDEKIAGRAAYNVDYTYVNYYLSHNHNVIMDSPCLYDVQLNESMEAAANNNAVYKYIECYLNDATEVNKRLAARERKASQLEILTREQFDGCIDKMQKPESHYLVVDTSQPVETYLKAVLDYLEEKCFINI